MKYRIFSHSSLGPKYAKKGWNCQDSSATWETNRGQVIAVADGHGNSDCFRSDIGSNLAIEATKQTIENFCEDMNIATNDTYPISLDLTNVNKFKFVLWEKWRELVKKDWDSKTLDDYRYETVTDEYKERYESKNPAVVERYLYNAYGTTLLVAIDFKTQILLLQIGDGTCLILQQDGEFETPIPGDDSNFLNVTSSLCEDNAYVKIRHSIIDCTNDMDAPIAIFLSTDGLDDCYPAHENSKYLSERVYATIINNVLIKGYESTGAEIKTELLAGMTKKGSQDDISLAYMLCDNKEMLSKTNTIIKQAQAEREHEELRRKHEELQKEKEELLQKHEKLQREKKELQQKQEKLQQKKEEFQQKQEELQKEKEELSKNEKIKQALVQVERGEQNNKRPEQKNTTVTDEKSEVGNNTSPISNKPGNLVVSGCKAVKQAVTPLSNEEHKPKKINDFIYVIEKRGFGRYIKILNYKGNGETVKVPAEIEKLPVKVIASRAFANNPTIKEVIFPEGVNDIDNYAFIGCRNLTHVNIPKSIKNITEKAFTGCPAILEKTLCEINLRKQEK